jgi:penicillin-binding protein 1A
VKSLNVPSVKIIEQIGVPYSIQCSRRLGLFSPLNPDFTLVLGSSSLTLYEITRAFHVFNNLGKKVVPLFITAVTTASGEPLLGEVSLDVRFEKEILPHQEALEKERQKYLESLKAHQLTLETVPKEKAHPFFFQDENQLISPQTAYLMTSLLKATIEDPEGTAVRAQSLGREIAGKTGSTNKYFDAWFVGYSPELTAGVWVGFDQERSLGVGEVGGRAALPIWMSFMQSYLEARPRQSFTIPDGIIFVNVDAKTGRIPQDRHSRVVRQAFREDFNVLTDPAVKQETERKDLEDFLREDL